MPTTSVVVVPRLERQQRPKNLEDGTASYFLASLNGAGAVVSCNCADFCQHGSCADVWLANIIYLTIRRAGLPAHFSLALDFTFGSRIKFTC